MPRKVVPRWGDIGVAKVPRFTLKHKQVANLGRCLGLRASALARQKANLESIGARYRLWLQQDENGPSQAEQNAALKKLSASPEKLECTLAQLDHATRARLVDALSTHPLTKYRGGVTRLDQIARDTPELVLNCAKLALAEGQKRRGPSPRKTLPAAIRWLAQVYEETTGREFTHTPYEKTEYTGTPQSHGGRFVTTFLKIVDEDLALTSIATEMARFVQAREAERQSSHRAVQTI